MVAQFSCIDYQRSCVCTRRPKRVKATRHGGRGTINIKKSTQQSTNKQRLDLRSCSRRLEIGNSKKLQAKALRSSKSSNKTGQFCFVLSVHVRIFFFEDLNQSFSFFNHHLYAFLSFSFRNPFVFYAFCSRS